MLKLPFSQRMTHYEHHNNKGMKGGRRDSQGEGKRDVDINTHSCLGKRKETSQHESGGPERGVSGGDTENKVQQHIWKCQD